MSNCRNLKERLLADWEKLQIAKKETIGKSKKEEAFIATLSEQQKLMYTKIELDSLLSEEYRERELIHFVLNYISVMLNPRSSIFFD